jgi:hypothetical protein
MPSAKVSYFSFVSIWVLVVAFSSGLWLVSLPTFQKIVSTLTYDHYIIGDTLWTAMGQRQAMAILHLTPQGYASYKIILSAINLVVFYGISALILFRGPHTWFNAFTAIFLVVLGGQPNFTIIIASVYPWIGEFFRLNNLISWLMFFLFLNIFPDGRFVPAGMFFVFMLFSAFYLVLTLIFNYPMLGGPPLNVLVVGSIIVVGAQIYRYRQISTPLQRQQTKWVVFFTSAFILAAIVYLLSLGDTHAIYLDFVQIGILLIPLSLAAAILRYRIWDIDVIIRRTLIYGTLIILLSLIFLIGILGFQATFTALTGENSPLAIVLSTLGIAAIFNPLRIRIRRQIDRLFYRSRYDAQRTLEAFAAMVRVAVDIDEISSSVLAVVQDTLQPEFLALWLQPIQQNKKEL